MALKILVLNISYANFNYKSKTTELVNRMQDLISNVIKVWGLHHGDQMVNLIVFLMFFSVK
jgi:hypothetical protein